MMKLDTIPTLTLVITLGAFACGPVDDDQAVIDEAAAYLGEAEAEDSDDLSADAAGGMLEQEVDQLADEAAEDLPDPTVEPEAGACDLGALRQRVIATYDADGNGTLDASERAQIRQDLGDMRQGRPRLFQAARRIRRHAWHAVRWAFDVNHDGVLDDAERAELVAAAEQRCEARRQRVLDNFDANGDGTLDDSERAAARAARRARVQQRFQDILAAHDTNGDGVLDQTEREALRAAVRAEFRSRRQAVKTQFDLDGNGVLDAAERDALKAAIRQAFADGTRLLPRNP